MGVGGSLWYLLKFLCVSVYAHVCMCVYVLLALGSDFLLGVVIIITAVILLYFSIPVLVATGPSLKVKTGHGLPFSIH